LLPWRFVIVPAAQRERLAQVFALALQERDPGATAPQLEQAREKAFRSPFLMLAIAKLCAPDAAREPWPAKAPGLAEPEVGDAERLVSFGCAIQNIVLSAHAAGFGTGLTSGQALASPRLRALFSLADNEQAVCCINIGTVTKHKAARLRPALADYVSTLA
jgi:nitroreductase